jgi:hypothetical protein
VQPPAEDDSALAPDSQPSFVAQARRRAFWRSRPVRGLLWLVFLLLLLGLAGQVAVSQRDWLAARWPRLTPALHVLCAPLKCSVQPYRQLEAIVIDGVAFNRVAGNNFRFSVTLRNTAYWPVAGPALELILIDAQGQTLVRRVLTAAELGVPPALAARGEFSSAHTLSLSDAANPGAVTDYRVAAFYP